jgi:hypothetical protein
MSAVRILGRLRDVPMDCLLFLLVGRHYLERTKRNLRIQSEKKTPREVVTESLLAGDAYSSSSSW